MQCRNFLLAVRFIDDRGPARGGPENPPSAAEGHSPRGKRARGGSAEDRSVSREHTTILKLVRAEQISRNQPRYEIYVHTHIHKEREREREREEDKVIRASTCKMEDWKE